LCLTVKQDIVKKIKEECFLPIKPLMGKTDGWVTRFIDYAIVDIKKNHQKQEDFKKKFKYFFPELCAIIDFASSSIE